MENKYRVRSAVRDESRIDSRVFDSTSGKEWKGSSGPLDGELAELRRQLVDLDQRLYESEVEQERLKRELEASEAAKRRCLEWHTGIERENAELTNLYVASYRLTGTLDRNAALEAIKEIIINLIGSEELGIFEIDQSSSALSLISHFGLDPAAYDRVPIGSGLIGRVASTGQSYIVGSPNTLGMPAEANLSACIPLKLDGDVIGAIAVFRLLAQKNGFADIDRQLFDLLATHAAPVLWYTRPRVAS